LVFSGTVVLLRSVGFNSLLGLLLSTPQDPKSIPIIALIINRYRHLLIY
jgi:hypothetical protein